MPELPEVEVTRRSFASQIAGAQVLSVTLGKPLRWPLGRAPSSLVGARVQQVRRRGKYLLIYLDRGTLRLHDPRRFGAVIATDGDDDPVARKLLDGLGMEPLDAHHFRWEPFRDGLARSRTPIKLLLLGGKLVVGVGNIYASEVLFASRIAPTTPAQAISAIKARRLFQAIRGILALAVERGGTTLRDFSNADGLPGHFQLQAKVYGREGLPCVQCGRPIALLRQGQRSTFYCPHCQKS